MRIWSKHVRRLFRAAGFGAVLGLSAAGCKDSGDNNNPPPPPGDVTVNIAANDMDFFSPLDAAPGPDGKMVYFTGLTEEGPAVFSTAAEGGAKSILHEGDPLSAPFGVMSSLDGNTLYVVDTGAQEPMDPNDEEAPLSDALGRIFSMPSSGGVPQAMTGADGTSPRSLTVAEVNGSEQLYFTGTDRNDVTMPAIYSMAPGGEPTVVFSGAPLADPSGIAVTKDGTVYVADFGNDAQAPGVIEISGGSARMIAEDLRLGGPAGVALSTQENVLYVSGNNLDTGMSTVFTITLATGDMGEFDGGGIGDNVESGGVHRAHNANVFAWANSGGTLEDLAGGTVYVLRGLPE